jgi:hypothetical protein
MEVINKILKFKLRDIWKYWKLPTKAVNAAAIAIETQSQMFPKPWHCIHKSQFQYSNGISNLATKLGYFDCKRTINQTHGVLKHDTELKSV